ncbi:MAG TPA: hypothetical protein PLW10_09150 [Myxococcota bacterium]|nr:hypothetical protein [Myxococcales bacterium]MCA9609869.1 hypothetical protein [Myxococcales bacterium]HPG25785.1 hypothetical protein [Myxococcota bacterium]
MRRKEAFRASRGRNGGLVPFLVAGLLLAGCLTPAGRPWGAGVDEASVRAALTGLPPEAAETLLPLSGIFYERITSRRFNSRATFEDPSVRQFFPTVAAYSDYYAALVDALDEAHVRYNRPTRVELLEVSAGPAVEAGLRLRLRFVGPNDLPLRWWSASLERTDEWQWRDGRWWVVPGKV